MHFLFFAVLKLVAYVPEGHRAALCIMAQIAFLNSPDVLVAEIGIIVFVQGEIKPI